jgi:hypothetical protein
MSSSVKELDGPEPENVKESKVANPYASRPLANSRRRISLTKEPCSMFKDFK